MVEIFFEKFQVPAVYVAVQGVLSLYIPLNTDSPLENQQELSLTPETELLTLSLSMKGTLLHTAAKEWTWLVGMLQSIFKTSSEKAESILPPVQSLS